VRHAIGGEPISMELGDGVTLEHGDATQHLAGSVAGGEATATWHVRIGPETRWVKVKVFAHGVRPLTRVVPVRP
jgi:hypothetical protein